MSLTAVRRQYDTIAHRYEALFFERQAAKIEGLRQALPTRLPRPCLDLGAGTGLVSKLFGHPFIAFDCSAGMLAYAPGDRICGSMTHLPFTDDTFPLVVSVSALTTNHDTKRMLSEAIRVLKRNGILGLSVLNTEDIGGIERYLRNSPELLDCRRMSNGTDMLMIAQKVP